MRLTRPSRFTPLQRLCAGVLLAALLAGCTRAVARPEIERRHLAMDWEHSGAPLLDVGGLAVRGIVLTPAQWPLEGSMKRLLALDFVGVIDALDVTFHSSTLPEGALRDVYDLGYVPAYVQVRNPGGHPVPFDPMLLTVAAEPGRTLEPIAPEDVPTYLRRVDWDRTAGLIAASLFIVAIAIVARDSKMNLADLQPRGSVTVNVGTRYPRGDSGTTSGGGAAYAEAPHRADPGVLAGGPLAPGEVREGFVFFSHRGLTVDWQTARLAVP